MKPKTAIIILAIIFILLAIITFFWYIKKIDIPDLGNEILIEEDISIPKDSQEIMMDALNQNKQISASKEKNLEMLDVLVGHSKKEEDAKILLEDQKSIENNEIIKKSEPIVLDLLDQGSAPKRDKMLDVLK